MHVNTKSAKSIALFCLKNTPLVSCGFCWIISGGWLCTQNERWLLITIDIVSVKVIAYRYTVFMIILVTMSGAPTQWWLELCQLLRQSLSFDELAYFVRALYTTFGPFVLSAPLYVLYSVVPLYADIGLCLWHVGVAVIDVASANAKRRDALSPGTLPRTWRDFDRSASTILLCDTIAVNRFVQLAQVTCWNFRGGGSTTLAPVHVYTDAHFWAKIGFKLQSLCKMSNISTSDPQFFL